MHKSQGPPSPAAADSELVKAAMDVEQDIEKTTRSSTSPTIRSGRPSMATILDESVCKGTGGRTALLLCGPHEMKSDMREALVDGYDRLDELNAGYFEYFEATFGW